MNSLVVGQTVREALPENGQLPSAVEAAKAAEANLQRAEPIREATRDSLPTSPTTDPEAVPAEAVKPGESTASQETTRESQPDAITSDSVLQLSDVIASVYAAYPSIEKARLENPLAGGQVLEAFGAYDTKLEGYSLAEPLGFYNTFRHGIGVARQTWWGGYLSAGYRIGRGQFQPWYKERETNEGGEFSLGLGLPLLQGRAIDPQRVAVFQAALAQRAADPMLQAALLSTSRDAAVVYWDWIAVGAILSAQQSLLELATERGKQYEVGVEAEKFPEIELIFNAQLIAERQGKVLETEQKFRASTFKLSLYLRNESGAPLIPSEEWLPKEFPGLTPLLDRSFDTDFADAISRRPELRLLQLAQRQVQWDQELARNNLLPRLDLVAEAAQDAGFPASSSNDKGQFEMLVGVQGEVPIQRRKARGTIQSTAAKIGQYDQELRLQQDRIGAELQTAYNALSLTEQVVRQGELALKAAQDTLSRYRIGFQEGKVDLIYINFLETKLNETEIKLLEARRNWFIALAEMQAALGLDPLDQAMLINIGP